MAPPAYPTLRCGWFYKVRLEEPIVGEVPAPYIVAMVGALGGVALGLSARLGRFCTLAAIEDAMFSRDMRRLRMWALAIGVAVAGVIALRETGTVAFSQALYSRLDVNPLAWIAGGVMFGIGMAFCGTCGFGTLARVGGGDLRALFVFLVLGIAAYMAIAGPTAQLREIIFSPLDIPNANAANTLYEIFGADTLGRWLMEGLIVALLVGWALSSAAFRASPARVFWAVVAGLAIVSGWWVTGTVGLDPFDPQPLVSHTYTVPLGQTLIYLMTMTNASLTFGVASTLGVIGGAFAGALIRGEFRWEGADDAREMRRHLVGAVLMGTGGVLAGGCTIGQGLSAASMLAISAPIVLASIWCGVWLGLTYLLEGSVARGFRALFNWT